MSTEHPVDCLYCQAGEPMNHTYQPPLDAEPTRLVHITDEEPCLLSPLDYGDLICVHGVRLVEVYTPVGVEPLRYDGPV